MSRERIEQYESSNEATGHNSQSPNLGLQERLRVFAPLVSVAMPITFRHLVLLSAAPGWGGGCFYSHGRHLQAISAEPPLKHLRSIGRALA